MFFVGDFTLITPASLLQLLCQEQQSVTIAAYRGSEAVYVQIVEGMIVSASYDDAHGKEAMYRWLVWDSGSFRVELLDQAPEHVEMMAHYEELVLEAARRRDELETALAPLLPYPQRTHLEAMLDQCPAVGGLALVSTEGRLLGAIGLDEHMTVHACSVVGGLAVVNEVLEAQQQLTLYITSQHRLLFARRGAAWLLAVPVAGASVSEATAQLQAMHVDYP